MKFKKETLDEKQDLRFPLTLKESMGALSNEDLDCERNFYERHVKEETPNVSYRFVSGTSKHRGPASHGTQRTTKKETGRRGGKRALATDRSDGEDVSSPDRPFTTNLRKRFQLDSKEALCLMGLKKKIARLYEQELAERELRQSTVPAKRPAAENAPVKRKRGRPPKNKTKSVEGEAASGWKCVSHDAEPLKIKISRSNGNEAASSEQVVADRVFDPSPRPLRRARPTAPSVYLDDSSESEKEIPSTEPFSDEALALQLHLDLNAPMLRRRRRSGGLLSPSSSEQ